MSQYQSQLETLTKHDSQDDSAMETHENRIGKERLSVLKDDLWKI